MWIFLVVMFQVHFIVSQFFLPFQQILVLIFFIFFQGLTIIAFDHGNLNLNTFKTLLSIGPTYAIMEFVECEQLMPYWCCIYLFIYFCVCNVCYLYRQLGCTVNVWGIQHSKRHGNFKAGYQVLLGCIEFSIYHICLCVSPQSSAFNNSI